MSIEKDVETFKKRAKEHRSDKHFLFVDIDMEIMILHVTKTLTKDIINHYNHDVRRFMKGTHKDCSFSFDQTEYYISDGNIVHQVSTWVKFNERYLGNEEGEEYEYALLEELSNEYDKLDPFLTTLYDVDDSKAMKAFIDKLDTYNTLMEL